MGSMRRSFFFVTPAQAGVQGLQSWMPAFAGMTTRKNAMFADR